MYCINCGIELSKGQAICPICKTKVCHPDFPADPTLATYPARPFQSEEYNRRGLMFVLTVIWSLLTVLPVGLEWMWFRNIVWSGYVTGGMALIFLLFILPAWFKNPNPVSFVPCDFAGIALYLLYINFATGGNWFLSFALPVTGFWAFFVIDLLCQRHSLSSVHFYCLTIIGLLCTTNFCLLFRTFLRYIPF